MPPKKKAAPVPKTLNKESLKEETKPELETLPPEPKKIPKKPFFRQNVDYDSMKRVQHIRAKLWKIRSCKASKFYESTTSSEGPRYVYYQPKVMEEFKNTFKYSTIKKSLQHLKKIEYDPSFLFKKRFFQKVCSTWRLESLFLLNNRPLENYEIPKTSITSKLKVCYLRFQTFYQVDEKLVDAFRRSRKCKLFIDAKANHLFMRAQVHSDKLHPYQKLKKMLKVKHEPQHDNQSILNTPCEYFEIVSYTCNSLVIDHLPSLPNLQHLNLDWRKFNDETRRDISSVKQYQKLQTLQISLFRREIKTLDFITDLPFLKEFDLNYSFITQTCIKALPNVTQLEKLSLSSSGIQIFPLQHIKEFISKNKGLKDLHLSLTIQNIGMILEDNEDLPLPNFEKLSLDLHYLESPYAGAAKRIAEYLKTHHSIKELLMSINQSSADINAVLLKDGLAKMKSLQKLTLNFCNSGGLEDNKLKNLKDVFTNLTDLIALELNVNSDALTSRELSPILDGLSQLKNLRDLKFKLKLLKLTPASFNKFSNFLITLRRLKVLEIRLLGVSKEDANHVKETIFPRFSLSNNCFCWISDAMGYLPSYISN